MDKLGLNLGYILVQAGSFFIILVVLIAWVYKPVLNMLDKRRKTIAQGLEDARVASEARENAEQDAQKIIADAQQKAQQIMREASERAESSTREIQASAEAEGKKARESALSQLEQERNQMLGELRGEVAALAIAAAQKLLGEALDEKRQHVLLNEFFSGIKDKKLVVLTGVNAHGSHAEVISALPLTPEEETLVKKNLESMVADTAAITFHVDPDILGGVIIRIGDQVIDGSVSGQLQSLHHSLL